MFIEGGFCLARVVSVRSCHNLFTVVDMNDEGAQTSTINAAGRIIADACDSLHPRTALEQASKETQQINVVDDATLQAVLGAMSETEMNAFLEELNKTGRAGT